MAPGASFYGILPGAALHELDFVARRRARVANRQSELGAVAGGLQ